MNEMEKEKFDFKKFIKNTQTITELPLYIMNDNLEIETIIHDKPLYIQHMYEDKESDITIFTKKEIVHLLRTIEIVKPDTVRNVKVYKELEELENKLKNKLNALYGKKEK